ncbi:hypothetical protein M413DRAFT_16402 [Hebeloma cylindrosporum]|uniref:Uncharacterized protein n=1 Tax=Hebeloma cylindrosporum TaxID=76867 RepID=A0A0C2Z0I0_HEBCY|nr:hypothetical protein M413DRAFT_16402 [Hebeloma cylindrosporum h7]
MVGIARCIAMVVIWNDLTGGDADYCAILVVVNAALQIVLYSPFSVLLINVIGGNKQQSLHVSYGTVAISVLIQEVFAYLLPFSLIGLLYTIIVLFAYQGHRIRNLGPVFRVFVPLILYFVIMWTSTFGLIYHLARREMPQGAHDRVYGYETAVVQAFTAASNDFELAIAVAIAVYSVNSEQALAANIVPLIEVPVLLGLTWVALYLRYQWNSRRRSYTH